MINKNVFTVDVEEWFHILDSPAAPKIDKWGKLSLRAEYSMDKILQLLSDTKNKATFFWLGWMAERMPKLVQKCKNEGHEIASHGYAHVLAYQVGRREFRNDITKAKVILENIIGQSIRGFRAPGFGITEESQWAFDVIKEVGYKYDASIFPANRGHGGMRSAAIGPHFIRTNSGYLPEIPVSVVEIFNKRINFFGGGYLRISPIELIHFGIQKLKKAQQPLIVYVHPRELDPNHPRLPLNPFRKFKCYTNLSTTFPKLKTLCHSYSFCTMEELVDAFIKLHDNKWNYNSSTD